MKMIKNKRFLFVFLSLCLLLSSASVLAKEDKKGATYLPSQEEKVGGVVRESQTYKTDQFELMTYVDEKLFPSFDETVENWQKKLKTMAWFSYLSHVDFILVVVYNLFSFDVMYQLSDGISDVMKSMSSSFTGTLLTFFMALLAMSVVFRGLWKQDFSVMMSILTKGILAVALLYSISFNPDAYFKLFNSVTTNFENILLKVNPSLSSEGTFDVDEGFTSPKATGVLVENSVYQALKYKPYLRMQYGTANETSINSAVNKEYTQVEGKRNRITNYLQANPYTQAGVEKRKNITEQEYQVLKNTNIGANQTPSVIVSLMIYNFNAIVQLIFYLSLAIIRIGLQFSFIAMMVMLPLMLILSLMPTYENLWMNYIKGIMNVCLYKALTVFFVLLSTSILSVGYEVAGRSNNIFYETFITLMYIAGIVFVFLKRKFVFDILKDAHSSVTDKTSHMAERFHDVTKGAPKHAVKHAGNVAIAGMTGGIGGAVATGLGGKKFGRSYIEAKRNKQVKKENKQREAEKEQQAEEMGKKQKGKSGEVVSLDRKKKANKGSSEQNKSQKNNRNSEQNKSQKNSSQDSFNRSDPSEKAKKETATAREGQSNPTATSHTASSSVPNLYEGTKRDRRFPRQEEPVKHLTQWEVQQKIDERKAREQQEALSKQEQKKERTSQPFTRPIFRMKRADED